MSINDQNYVNEAEKSILALKNMKNRKGYSIPLVSTSKIRNLLAMSADIYNDVLAEKSEKLSPEICSRIEYLRMRFYYEAGRDTDRDQPVRNFIEKTDILNVLKSVNGDKNKYILFNRYLEALVAFRKYYGDKE